MRDNQSDWRHVMIWMSLLFIWASFAVTPALAEGDATSAPAPAATAAPSQPATSPAPKPMPAQPSATASTPAAVDVGALAIFNDYMHNFNLWVWQQVESGSSLSSFVNVPDSLKTGTRNVLQNFVNEPITMLSWAVAGDYGNVASTAQRFWVNTTEGWLGVSDVASSQGLPPRQIDIGLALCARGIGEGGYIVLPFVGPRTVRDALSDFFLINGLTYAALAPVIGFPPSLQSFAVVEVTEEGARIALMRQIDHGDDGNASQSAVRESYLAERRGRCQQIVTELEHKRGTTSTNGHR